MGTVTIISYGDGGFDPTKPDNNIIERVEVDLDDNGDEAPPAAGTTPSA